MISRESPSPIYQQLKEIIKRKVEDGEFMPGERIPTEYELCDMFAVSRAPVRQALIENTGAVHWLEAMMARWILVIDASAPILAMSIGV